MNRVKRIEALEKIARNNIEAERKRKATKLARLERKASATTFGNALLDAFGASGLASMVKA